MIGRGLCILLGCLGPLAGADAGRQWRIGNSAIEVTLGQDGALSVAQTASRASWQTEMPAQSGIAVSGVAVGRDRQSLRAKLTSGGTVWSLALTLPASDPEVEIVLSAGETTPMSGNLSYPPPLRAPGPDYNMVLPHKTGLMFSVADATARRTVVGTYGCYAGSGLSMPWFGYTNMGGGMLALFETPADAGVNVQLGAGGGERAFTSQVYWQPVRGTTGYARKLRYRFFDAGGYVALAKYYRSLLIANGEFVTLRRKAELYPQLSKLIGAIDLHMRGNDEDQLAIAGYMESHGVKRMLINTGASAATVQAMRQRGYLVGTYRLYTDIMPPESGRPEEYTRGYPHDGYTLKDGQPVHGFAYSTTRKSTYRCSRLQIPLMKDLVPPMLREKDYEALFLDVVTASPPQECYAEAHPLDRRQDLQWKKDILRYAASLGVVVGSEDGNDWAAPHLVYFEGLGMPRRFGYVRGVTVNNWPQTFELSDDFINVDLNERVRVPLWDLVFHDSVVSSWRWNFTPDRYADPKGWDKHDLLEIIAGSMPIFLVSRTHLETHGERIVRSYKDCAEWNARTGWDELIDHRALTHDRTVQESRFSSGWGVRVNFSPSDSYVVQDGETIKPQSYKIYRWKKDGAGSK